MRGEKNRSDNLTLKFITQKAVTEQIIFLKLKLGKLAFCNSLSKGLR